MAEIIVDPGSTHMGKLKYAKEHIDNAWRAGAHIIKFQLFSNPKGYEGGNIELPLKWWDELVAYANKRIQVTASVFDEDKLNFLISKEPQYIKFAYSKKLESKWIDKCIRADIFPIVSCDVMTDHLISKDTIRLYCIPEYPVRYEIAFDSIFPRFDGFSDHTLGIRQSVRAFQAGAKWVEKHTTLKHSDVNCPDNSFAVSYSEIEKLASQFRAPY